MKTWSPMEPLNFRRVLDCGSPLPLYAASRAGEKRWPATAFQAANAPALPFGICATFDHSK